MRIGVADLNTLNPQRGIGRAILSMATIWRQHGHEVTPVQLKTSRLPVLRNLKWGLGLGIEAVDVLLFPHFLGFEAVCIQSSPIPTVVIVHDIGGIECQEDLSESTLLTYPMYWLGLTAARRANRVVTISEFTRQRLLRYWRSPSYPVEVVHYGVDHSVFYPRKRTEARRILCQHGINVTDDDLLLTYVGAEYARKNLGTLAKTLAILKARGLPARLIKVGAAHDQRRRAIFLSQIASFDLVVGRDILFTDAVEDDFLAEIYNAADVFVTASTYEGFGLPLLEAMACGLPSVVSNAGSLPEVGGVVSVYVDPYNATMFADRIVAVAEHTASDRRMLSVAQAEGFSMEKSALQLLDVMLDLQSRSPVEI